MNGPNTTPWTVDSRRVRGLPWQVSGYVSADQSVSNTTTLTLITGWSFPIGPNEVWQFREVLWAGDNLIDGATTGGGFRCGLAVPSGATNRIVGTLDQASGIEYGKIATSSTGIMAWQDDGTQVTQLTGRMLADITVANGATAGTVDFKFAQATANATATKVKIGSHIIGHRIQ